MIPAILIEVAREQRPAPAKREKRRHLVAALLGLRVSAFELGTVHEVFGLWWKYLPDSPAPTRPLLTTTTYCTLTLVQYVSGGGGEGA
jgi:hypothetical protein